MAVNRILKHTAKKGSANVGVMNSLNGRKDRVLLQVAIGKCSVKICNSAIR